jgi:hypothetical protein
VLDRDLGRWCWSSNARPGLAIQIANRRGLLRRLKICEGARDFASLGGEQRIEFAKQEFRHPVGPVYAPAEVNNSERLTTAGHLAGEETMRTGMRVGVCAVLIWSRARRDRRSGFYFGAIGGQAQYDFDHRRAFRCIASAHHTRSW